MLNVWHRRYGADISTAKCMTVMAEVLKPRLTAAFVLQTFIAYLSGVCTNQLCTRRRCVSCFGRHHCEEDNATHASFSSCSEAIPGDAARPGPPQPGCCQAAVQVPAYQAGSCRGARRRVEGALAGLLCWHHGSWSGAAIKVGLGQQLHTCMTLMVMYRGICCIA